MNKLLFLCFVSYSFVYADVKIKEADSKDGNRPCSLDDIPCMKKVFHEKGWCHCEKDFPYKNDTLELQNLKFEMPMFRLSARQNLTFHGLPYGEVAELFVKENGDTKFGITFPKLSVDGDLKFHYHRGVKEDLIVSTKTYECTENITTVTTIPAGKTFKDKIKVLATVNSKPQFCVENRDRIQNEEIAELFEYAFKESNAAGEELYSVRAKYLLLSYVENIICGSYHPTKPYVHHGFKKHGHEVLISTLHSL